MDAVPASQCFRAFTAFEGLNPKSREQETDNQKWIGFHNRWWHLTIRMKWSITSGTLKTELNGLMQHSTVPRSVFPPRVSDRSCFVMVTVGVVGSWPLTSPKGHQHELHDSSGSGHKQTPDQLRAKKITFSLFSLYRWISLVKHV